MACKTLNEQYTQVVKSLISSNPKYRNFDNAAAVVLNNNELDPIQKKQAVQYFAQIFKGLVDLDSKAFSAGNLVKVLEVSPQYNDTTKYLQSVNDIYKTEKTEDETPVKVDAYDAMMDSVKNLSEKLTLISLKDIEDVLKKVNRYFNSVDYETEEELENAVKEVHKNIQNIVDASSKGTAEYKNSLHSLIVDNYNSLINESNYVDINTLLSDTRFKRVFIVLKNGEAIQGVQQGDNTFIYDSVNDTFGDIIPAETIGFMKPIRNNTYDLNNMSNGEVAIDGRQLAGGFVVKAVDKTEAGAVQEALDNMNPSATTLEIKAVRITDIGEQRVGEIHNKAKKEEAGSAILNRKHETFETPSQIEKLKKDKNAKIITVRRPNSDDQIALIGTVRGTDLSFNLFNLDNYTIVDANNNTTPFDFNNPEHIELLKKEGVMYNYGNTKSITNKEVDTLIKLNQQFQEFKEKIITALGSENSMEVTDMFFGEYQPEVTTYNAGFEKLEDKLKKQKDLSLSVTVVTVNENQEIVKDSEERGYPLPVHFTKYYNKEEDKFIYTLKSTLPNNKRVLDKEGMPVDEEDFITEFLTGGREDLTWNDLLDPVFQHEYKNIDQKGTHYAPRFILKFKGGAKVTGTPNLGYQSVNYVGSAINGNAFMSWAYRFSALDPNNENEVKQFDKDYTFNYLNHKGALNKNHSLRANIASKVFEKDGQVTGVALNIEIRSAGIEGQTSPLDKFVNSQGTRRAFNINLLGTKNKLGWQQKVQKRLKEIESEYIPAAEIALGIDFNEQNKQDFLNKAFEVYNELGEENAPQGVKALVERITRFSNDFSNALADTVDERVKENFGAIIEAQKEEGSTELIDILKSLYVYKEEGNNIEDYNFRRLVVDENSGVYLNVQQKSNIHQTRTIKGITSPILHRRQFIVSTKRNNKVKESHNYKKPERVDTSSTSTKTKIQNDSAKNNIQPTSTTNKAVIKKLNQETSKAENKKQPKPTKTGGIVPGAVKRSSKGKKGGSNVFQAGVDIVDATLAELPRAEQWLKDTLPQFDLNKEDLADIVDLSSINGNVLGMYKDRVLYLNKQLAGAATLYHEAFHGVFRHLMNQPKRRELLDSVIGQKKYAKKFTDESLRQFGKDRAYNLSLEQLRDLVAEEILADGFKDYMVNKGKPRGIIARLFQALKKLLRFFNKHSRLIDREFRAIDKGMYSTVEIQSGIYDGKKAFKAIPGVMRHFEEEGEGHRIFQTQEGALSDIQQKQLVNVIVSNMIQDTTEDTFDERFERAVDSMLQILDVNKLVEQNPDKEREIRKKYTNLMNQYRFILGARMNKEKYGEVYDENRSNNSEFDNREEDILITFTDGTEVDNTNGSYSKKLLKELVRENYDAITAIEIELENTDNLDEINEGDLEGQKNNNEDVKDNEEEDNYEDYGGTNPINQVRYVRALLATIEKDTTDELGVTLPNVVDAVGIFPVLLKITSNLNPYNTVARLRVIGNQLIEDGFIEEGNDVLAVYNRIISDTGVDSNGLPTKNKHIYDMFVEVLNNLELDYTMFEITTPERKSADQLVNESVGISHKIDIKDSVLISDVKNVKDDLINQMILKYTTNNAEEASKHKQAVKELIAISKEIVSSEKLFIARKNEEKLAEDYVEKIDKLFKDIGLNLPKSLIRLSLVGIDAVENNRNKPVSENLKQVYDLHEGYIKQKKYLEKDFFRSLQYVLNQMYSGDLRTSQKFIEFIDEDIKKRGSEALDKGRFLSILKKSSEYLLKYNPQKIQAVIRNAEGKNIYRYAKYNPLLQLSQIAREEGLYSMLALDPYFDVSLKAFMQSNPVFGEYLKKIEKGLELTNEDKAVETYIRNLNMSMLGGVQQRIGDKLKEGKAFKHIDAKSLYLIHLASFMTRQVVNVDGATSVENQEAPFITMYKRQFHQLESTQTNFLINGLYKSFIDVSQYKNSEEKKRKGRKQLEGKYNLIVEDLLGVIKQEYDRISNEVSTITKKLANYKDGTKNELVLKYNAVRDKDGSINITDEGLRAFKFNRLQTFWNNNDDIKSTLLNLAKEGKSFEDLEASSMTLLKSRLDLYSEQEFKNHLSKLVQLGVVNSETIDPKNTNRPGETLQVLSSPYLPNELKVNFNNIAVKEEYASKSYNDDNGVYNLVFDAFMNHWYNTLMFNQIFDGDPAMGTKNDVDYVKRLKKFAAAGPNMKSGTHKVSYVATIEEWVHDVHVEYGPYTTKAEIYDDPQITDENIRTELIEGFENDVKNAGDKTVKKFGQWYPVFDGQSISSLMHQMDQFRKLGRLTPRAKEILIAKHYRELTPKEVAELKAFRITNNSKKTVTAGRYTYHKLSEYFIDRNDVSYFYMEKPADITDEQFETIKAQRLQEIHNMYEKVFSLREQIAEAKELNQEDNVPEMQTAITDIIKTIHENFRPLKHRKVLHDMLNSMEFQQIDQMMDVEASKNATLFPTHLSIDNRTENGHYNLELSSIQTPNNLKYLQVETSGVKETAKVGVQKKVLLAADIPLLQKQLEQEKANGNLTSEQEESLNILAREFDNYNRTLKETTDARFEYLREIIREGGNLDIGNMYKIIRSSLEAQNAPINQIQLFDLTPEGLPAVNPNLPMVRKVVEYFFFSHYSQHVTDEKAAGFKSFHVSQWGWQVVVDENNNVITTEEIKKDPQKYAGDKYKTRKLGISVETDPDTGIKTYFTEVIVPMPQFENEAHKKWYMDTMRKAFGTRIPTEDKRSMMALKIVDFMDSSKMNTIIAPQLTHILAGSDFDIDSLFGQMYASYKNVNDQYVKYGDTSMYANEEAGKFVEFLEYMASKPEFKSAIAKKRRALYQNSKEYFDSDDQIDALDFEMNSPIVTLIRDAFGFTEDEIEAATYIQDNVARIQELKEEIKKLHAEKEEIKEEIFGDDTEVVKKNVSKKLEELQILHEELHSKQREKFADIAEKKELYEKLDTSNKVLNYIMHFMPIINTLEEFGIPVTYDSYTDNPIYGAMVAPRYQNENLDSAIKLLSNEHLFKNLYINQKTSGELFEKILKDVFGLEVKDVIAKGDINTIDSVVESKTDTSSFKDGIGIAANLNKFLSLASAYELNLNGKNVIWSYNKPIRDENGKITDYKRVGRNSFHELNENQQRSIEIVGSILGVFADAAKDPIPTALQLDEVNSQVALVMASLGLDPGMVMGFGFMPEVQNAVRKVKQAKEAITEDYLQEIVWFNAAIKEEVLEIVGERPNPNSTFRTETQVFSDLINKGLIQVKKGKAPSIFNFGIDTTNLAIEFNYPGNIDVSKLKNGQLSLNEIGFKLSTTDGVELTEDEAKVVLLKLYERQIGQVWQIKKAGNLTNFHKKLNPNIPQFDKVQEGIEWLQSEGSIFTEESIDRLLGKAGNKPSVYGTISEVAKDMKEQLDILFLERSPVFSEIQRLFGEIYLDKTKMADVFTGVIASRSYLNSILEEDPNEWEDGPQKDFLIKQQEAIRELMNPENLFLNKLGNELSDMKSKYPDNKFLSKLRAAKGNVVILGTDVDGTTEYPLREENISLIEKVKLKGELLDSVRTDLMDLYASGTEAKLFVQKLFWNEILRNGGQIYNVKGSYLTLFPASLQQEFSKGLNETLSVFTNANKIFDLGYVVEDEEGNKLGQYFVNNQYFKTEKEATNWLFDNRIDLTLELNSKLQEENSLEVLVDHLIKYAINDKENTKIPSAQKVSAFVDRKKGGQFDAAIVRGVKEKFGNENLAENIAKVFQELTSLEVNTGIPITKFDLSNPAQFKEIGKQELVFKASSNDNINKAIASIFGTYSSKMKKLFVTEFEEGAVTTEELVNAINFPAVIRVGRDYYKLKSVDDNNVIKSGEDLGKAETQGEKAVYQKLDTAFILSTSNQFGWNQESINKYSALVNGTNKLHINKQAINEEEKQRNQFEVKDTKAPVVEERKKFTRAMVEKETDKVFIFGDNFEDAKTGYVPKTTQAQIRGLDNAIGISTKHNRGTKEDSYLSDADLAMFVKHVDEQIQKAIDSGKTIVIPSDGIGTGKADLYRKSRRAFLYVNGRLNQLLNGNKPGVRQQIEVEWNRVNREIGTDADVLMREAADSAIVELKTDKKATSSKTTLMNVGEDASWYYNKKSSRYVGQSSVGTIPTGGGAVINNYGKVVMLARNSELKGTELDSDTKAEILVAHGLGATFVVGNMAGVDTQFHEYLNKIGATYNVYTHKQQDNSAVVTEGNIKYVKDINLRREMHNNKIALFTTRVSEKMAAAGLAPKGMSATQHFGNPFTGTDKEGAIKVKDIATAVDAFEDWLDGKAHKEVEPERREWILNQINRYKGAGLSLSYFSQGYRSHVDVLDERLNGAKSKKVVKKELGKVINEVDISNFNDYVKKSNNKLPAEFYTPSTLFKEFYNNSTGKRQSMPNSAKWFKNENGLYDMIDLDTGELYIGDVDLATGIKYDVTLAAEEMQAESARQIEFTFQGKKQTYTIKGKQIFNQSGKEVFKGNNKNSRKIFANLAVKEGKAVIVQITEKVKGEEVQNIYVVNNNNKVLSTATGDIMKKQDIIDKAISAANVIRSNRAQGNPNNLQRPTEDDMNNPCMG